MIGVYWKVFPPNIKSEVFLLKFGNQEYCKRLENDVLEEYIRKHFQLCHQAIKFSYLGCALVIVPLGYKFSEIPLVRQFKV